MTPSDVTVKVEYVVLDGKGRELWTRPTAEAGRTIAARWDREYPRDAPHRVIKRTLEEEDVADA